MRKTTLSLTKVDVIRRVKGKGNRTKKTVQKYWCVTVPKLGKGRKRHHFPYTKEGKAEAETFLELSRVQQANYGTAALTLSPAEREEYLYCSEALKPYGMTLREAVDFILPQLKEKNRSCKVKDLFKELLKAKTADRASERYLSDLRSRLGQFSEPFGEMSVASISTEMIDQWLRSLAVAPATRNNFRRVLIVAFNFAVNRGYLTKNPAKNSARLDERLAIGILSPEELSALIAASDEELLPYVLIGAFAGVRSAELERLDWSAVDLREYEDKDKIKRFGVIRISADVAKTAKKRNVKIAENLAQWLRPLARKAGPVAPENWRNLWDAARRSIGFGEPGTETEDEKSRGIKLRPWPNNALRHSFASYHMAHFEDEASLAYQMGNSPKMISEHYDKVVHPSEAVTYWSIKPETSEKIVAMTAG